MVRLYAPAQSARPGPPLAPVLGQHQIKVADFATHFNRETLPYVEGLPLGCRISKRGPRLEIRVSPPAAYLTLTAAQGRATRVWAALAVRGCSMTPAGVRTFLGSARSARIRLTRD